MQCSVIYQSAWYSYEFVKFSHRSRFESKINLFFPIQFAFILSFFEWHLIDWYNRSYVYEKKLLNENFPAREKERGEKKDIGLTVYTSRICL